MNHVTTHVDDGIALLISQFRDKPRLQGWLTALLSRVQEVEDAIWDVYVLRQLPNATAAQLDVLGGIVGQTRDDKNDTDYRVRINARILTNRSHGYLDELIVIAALLLPSPLVVRELYPKSVEIDIPTPVTTAIDPAGVTSLFLDRAKPPGTSVRVTYTVSPRANTFTWGSAYGGDAVTSGQHWGSVYSPSLGGLWAAVAG